MADGVWTFGFWHPLLDGLHLDAFADQILKIAFPSVS